jgi:hypothetical protein
VAGPLLGSPVRQLHVVGFTSDHGGLILSATQGAKTGSYLLMLDDGVRRQVLETGRGLTGRAESAPSRPTGSGVQSALSPREIQARLRSGRTIAQVAAEAGVGSDWIERFAAPVLAEQADAVVRAGQTVLVTPQRGASDRPLASAVIRNLADRGVRLTDDQFRAGWSSYQLIDDDWLVSFEFHARGRDQVAEWVYNPSAGELSSGNRLGAELGFVDSTRKATIPVKREPPPAKKPLTATQKPAPAAATRAAKSPPPPQNGRVNSAQAQRNSSGRAARSEIAANLSTAGLPGTPSVPSARLR